MALKPAAGFVRLQPAFLIDEPGRRVRKRAVRILMHGCALGLKEERPARAEPAQHIVDAGIDRDEFFVRRAFKVGPAILKMVWKLPSLLRMTPGATMQAQGR